MRRIWKIAGATLGAAVIIFAAVAAWTWQALRVVPDFYEQVREPPPKELGDELERRALEASNDIQRSGDWQLELTQDQVNAWLALDLPRKFPRLLPETIREPRVVLEPNSLQLGCAYDAGSWQGIISLEIEPFLTAETNEVALRVRRARAGAVPIPLARFLDPIVEAAQRGDWRIRWRERDGAPVALWKFPERHPDFGPHRLYVESLEILAGKLVVRGTSVPEESAAQISAGE